MNYVYTLLIQKWGIMVELREQVNWALKKKGENITSIHILISQFYKDSPNSFPPTRTIPTMIKEIILGVKKTEYIIKYNTNCTVHVISVVLFKSITH